MVGAGLQRLPKAGIWNCEPALKQVLSKIGMSGEFFYFFRVE